jgi:hypothetical protein
LPKHSQFLIVRHHTHRRFFFDVILRWLKVNFPHLARQFDVRILPARVKNWSPYVLHVPWLQDPVQQWSVPAYDQAQRLADECDRRGIPIVNRVDRLLNATKSRGAELMSQAGVRVPRMARINDLQEFGDTLLGLNLPVFIREDWGHSLHPFRIDNREDLSRVPWSTFERPLAVEIVDASCPNDGLYRKYRYVAADDVGISHHLHVSSEWVTRGECRIVNAETRAQELNYITRPDPNHDLLQRARRALGLDLVAFDYGYTPDGQMIVWEANPFPHFVFATKRLVYKNPAMHRTLMAIVRLYFSTAGLPIPAEIEAGLSLDFAAIERQFKIARRTNLADRLLALPSRIRPWAA